MGTPKKSKPQAATPQPAQNHPNDGAAAEFVVPKAWKLLRTELTMNEQWSLLKWICPAVIGIQVVIIGIAYRTGWNLSKAESNVIIAELKAQRSGQDEMPSYEDAEAINTSYEELVTVWRQAEEKKSVLEFVNQFRFKRVTWKCKIIEMPRVGETFYICGPDANTPPSSELPPKHRILASFSPNRFSTLVAENSRPIISGLLSIDPTDKSVAGIRLDECRIIQY